MATSVELDSTDDVEISDEELAALAMAADPDAEVDADAVPLRSTDGTFPELLPSWYMPVPVTLGGGTGRKLAVVAIIASLLLIIGEQAPWVHVEKLFKYDGEAAFTKDQGED